MSSNANRKGDKNPLIDESRKPFRSDDPHLESWLNEEESGEAHSSTESQAPIDP